MRSGHFATGYSTREIVRLAPGDARLFAPGMAVRVDSKLCRVRALDDLGDEMLVDRPRWWLVWQWIKGIGR
jgi:hypothetical protein